MVSRKAISYNIKIEASDNQGFIMTIGCGKFVYSTITDLEAGLHRYLINPQGLEKEYEAPTGPMTEPEAPRPPHQEGG